MYNARYFFNPSEIWFFLDRFSCTYPTPNFTDIRSIGAAPIHANKRTDMTKVIGAFRDYANSPNKAEMAGTRVDDSKRLMKVYPHFFAVNSMFQISCKSKPP